MSTVKPKVAVIYYSTYGHMAKLAQKVVEGAKEAGADVTLLQIKETLSDDVLAKMGAAPKPADVPIAQVEDLPNYDALIFGAPTRYGSPCAQYKALWDSTGKLWATGALNGKLAAFFTGSATQGGGQEVTHMSNMGHFVHHGMMYVPLGYGYAPIFSFEQTHGGSPWARARSRAQMARVSPTRSSSAWPSIKASESPSSRLSSSAARSRLN